ncbi:MULTISPECIES: metal-dependent hydrolase family protein [unclassified Caulobacter]|uniref:metal-dependent hydrolase family protein n=1 Tax=unclassified Caulobacter TaxID=2648921 RepID=UPI000D379054|nr:MULTISPECIES: amidohydrolase family protein [unclassified Caulobacter]PTS89839.1 Xaa-Pro dipeptidase [Caulobacter sp. HMWF009]PTT06018.1 Xaa-Pro dipeptidase [Caulobacter sp. HMWF025]
MRNLTAGVLALLATTTLGTSALAETLFVQAGRLLADPATGKVETARTVVIENGKVVRIADGYVSEPGGKVLDLKDSFVLPGLIDSHVHLTNEQSPNSRLNEVTRSPADEALVGAGFARKTLLAGFTTVADLGATNQAIFALRDGIRRGDVIGPRILAAGSAVSVHGGHGDVNGYSEEVMHVLRPTSVCSGPDDCRRAVREQVWLGADIIKITATGGVLSNTAAGLNQQFSDAELSAIVETAHRMGRKVTAHAHGVDGINSFLKAGGDSIEHGTYLDADSVALFKKNGGYLVPTLMAGDFVYRIASGPNNFLTPAQTAKALDAGPKMLAMARRAHEGGVRIAFGTDTGVSAHGDNAGEFVLLVKAGLTPLEAIQTATVNAADHFGLSNEIGSLAPGKTADLIAVKGDPLQDVAVLKAVTSVVKSGVVVK